MGAFFLKWMEDLKKLQSKPKLSILEINNYILEHPKWLASTIRNSVEMELYCNFCVICEKFEKCYEKLGSIKMERNLGCICNEFLNKEKYEVNKPQLTEYFNEVIRILGIT